jgi:hypothetical protein
MHRLIVLTLFLTALSNPSSAQDTIQKSETTYYVQTSEGQSKVCGIKYVLLYRDWTYRAGAPATVTGTLGWIETQDQIGMIFKVLGIDFPDPSSLKMMPLKPREFKIPQAFLEVGGKRHFVRQTYPCENPEGFCGRYRWPESADLFKYISTGNKLNLSFSRESNGLDVTLPIDTRREAARNPGEVGAFTSCIQSLAASAKSKFQ